MGQVNLDTKLSEKIFSELTSPFVGENGLLAESKIKKLFPDQVNAINSKKELDDAILKCKVDIKRYNTGLSLKFDKVEESINKIVKEQIVKGGEAHSPFDLNKLNLVIAQLTQYIQVNGIGFLKTIEKVIETKELEAAKSQIMSRDAFNVAEWDSKLNSINKKGWVEKDIASEAFKFNSTVLEPIEHCIKGLSAMFINMYYELDGFYYDNTEGVEPEFISKYTTAFEQLIKVLDNSRAKAVQYKIDKEYERLFPKEIKQKLADQVGLVCLLEYLSGQKTKQIKNVIKENRWEDFNRICQKLSKKEFYKAQGMQEYHFIKYTEGGGFIWVGTPSSIVPRLGSFIRVLSNMGMLEPQLEQIEIAKAFHNFFNLKTADIKYLGNCYADLSEQSTIYYNEIEPLVKAALLP